jgi:cold shock CspA family protein
MALMRVDMYSISHGYGFCVPTEGDGRVFFRVEDFNAADEVLPLMGEIVEVGSVTTGRGGNPRADSVRRLTPPAPFLGVVSSFDMGKGWGFLQSGGTLYFLHRSDLLEKFSPIIGATLSFYAGVRRGKPRACYVKQMGKVGE